MAIVNQREALLAILKLQRATYIDEQHTICRSSSYHRLISSANLKKLDQLIADIDQKIQELQTLSDKLCLIDGSHS